MSVEKARKELNEAIQLLVDCYAIWGGDGRTSAHQNVESCIKDLIEAVEAKKGV